MLPCATFENVPPPNELINADLLQRDLPRRDHLQRDLLRRVPRRLSISVSNELFTRLQHVADQQGRSTSNLCAYLLEKVLREKDLMETGLLETGLLEKVAQPRDNGGL